MRLSKLFFFLLLSATLAFGWGDEGHKIINRAAVNATPADMPVFFKAGIEHIVYNAPEPDRWRSPSEFTLKEAQEPDHFIDLERVEDLGELPEGRFEYIQLLYATRARASESPDDFLPQKVGFQPYAAIEVYGRLKVAFREYRQLKATGQPTDAAEQNAIFYAGWLGHYVGDASNPMHTTIHFNGWVGPNPHGYATAGVHSAIETDFVNRNLPYLSEIGGLVSKPKPLEEPFRDYVAYLEASHKLVEPMYQIEKKGGFRDAGTDEGRMFIRGRIAAGAQMLANLFYTAWIESEKPLPNRQAPTAVVPATKP